MIEAESLTRRFRDLTAVDALTFRVDSGEIFGFLGPNGAGKTTTVRMLTCLIAKTSGTARVGGHEIGDPRAAMAIRRMVGVVPDNVGLYEDLSAYRNLDFSGRLYDIADGPRREAIERLLRLLGVWERRDSVVGTFSKGMKQKLAIARALVHDPSVLFLDEPTANLDPEAAKTVRDFILQLSTEGKTILLNTHNLTEAQRLCDRIGILNTRLVTVGTPAELEASVGRPKVVIELEEVTDAILQAIQRVVPGPVTRAGTQLTVDVSNAGKENPALAAAIVGAGGRIKQISAVNPTLEDVYLTFVHKGHP